MASGRQPFVWTDEMNDTLRNLYPNNPTKEVAKAIGLGVGAVKSRAGVLGLKKAIGYNRMKQREIPQEKIDYILANYGTLDYRTIAKQIDVAESTVLRYRRILKIPRKPPSGYPKGHRPANWNKKRPGFHVGRMKESQFEKGHQPKNTLHDLAITIRYDHPKTRSGRAYKWIRIAKAKWVHYHRWVWEQANGPVPPKHVVIFIDNDTLNCELSNLKMISMADNARRNYNPAKAQQSSKNLTDEYIATRIAPGDKKLQKSLLLQRPDLIDLKRTQLKLNRELKNERRKQTQETA
jgi:hypothetical protein